MKTKKENQQEVIIAEVIAWAFVVCIIYIFVKLTFWFKGNALLPS